MNVDPSTLTDGQLIEDGGWGMVTVDLMHGVGSMPGVVPVLTHRLLEAEKRLTTLAKKAARYGTAPITWTRGVPYVRKTTYQLKTVYGWVSRDTTAEFTNLHIQGETPRVGEFRLVARVEPLGEGVNLVHVVPGRAADERFRSVRPSCEHCKAYRHRKDVLVVEDTAGAQLMVGRNCLQDYLGGLDPDKAVRTMGYLLSVNELEAEFGWGSFGRSEHEHDARMVMAWTACAIRLFGWCSKGQAQVNEGLRPTSSDVRLAVGPRPNSKDMTWERARWEQMHAALDVEKDFATADEVMTWARDELVARDDYTHNLKAILVRDMITKAAHFGLACSAVSAHARVMERKLKLAFERANMAGSKHLGAEGERLRGLVATVQLAKTIQSDWSESVLYKLATDDGDVLTWFASKSLGIAMGARVTVTGTVKRHTERDGIKETQLTRCKVEDAA